MATRIPPLLTPYLRLPPLSSLVLLTSVLGTSTNWLVLRYLYWYLVAGARRPGSEREQLAEVARRQPGEWPGRQASLGNEDREDRDVDVVLVSFLRDWDFWRREAGRLGLDLVKLSRSNHFRYVDGLTNLFAPTSAPAAPEDSAGRGYGASSVDASKGTREPAVSRNLDEDPFMVLKSPKLENIRDGILHGVSDVKGDFEERGYVAGQGEGHLKDGTMRNSNSRANPVVLIIDGLDLLLAATSSFPPSSYTAVTQHQGEECSVQAVEDMIFTLREQVHSTILSLSADTPLTRSYRPSISQSTTTSLETNHGSLLTSQAHQSRFIISLRPLQTGVARDISGVIRITRGAYFDDDDDDDEDEEQQEEEDEDKGGHKQVDDTTNQAPPNPKSASDARNSNQTERNEGQDKQSLGGTARKRNDRQKEKIGEMEALYFIGGSGGEVKVFERGSAGSGGAMTA